MACRAKVVSGAVVLALLVAAGCGDDDEDTTETGSAPASTTTTTAAPTTTLPSARVSDAFATPVDDTTATQGTPMDRGGWRSWASRDRRRGADRRRLGPRHHRRRRRVDRRSPPLVEQLNFRGDVLYRPVLAGPLPPTAGEMPSTQTPKVSVPPETDLTTVAGYDTRRRRRTRSHRDAPAVISDMELGTTNAIMRWQVGPAQLDGTTTDNTQLTTSGGRDAVKVVVEDTAEGLGTFNTMAEACFNRAESCPARAYAIQFDDVIAVASVRTTRRPELLALHPGRPHRELGGVDARRMRCCWPSPSRPERCPSTSSAPERDAPGRRTPRPRRLTFGAGDGGRTAM